MKIKLVPRLLAASLLSISSLLTIAMPLAHATPANCLWTGAGGNTNFNTAGNWSNCNTGNGGVPLAGDVIVFNPATGSSTVNLTNNLGVALGGVINNPAAYSSNTTSYKINTLTLASGGALSVSTTANCSYYPRQMAFGALITNGNAAINVDGYSLLGTNLTANGTLTLQSSSGGAFLSPLTGSSVSGGIVAASPVAYNTATSCGGSGGGGGSSNITSFSGFTVNSLTVQNGAYVFLNDTSYPISLGGGSGTGQPELYFTPNYDNNYNPVATTYTVSSPITLTANATVNAWDQATANFTGTISGSGLSLTMDPQTEGTVNFNFSSNSSSTQTGTQANPIQTVTIPASDVQASKYESVVGNETLVLDRERSGVDVLRGGILKGSGKIDNSVGVDNGGIIAPGHSPGCMTMGSIYLAGTYQVEIGGTTPCTGYDQLVITSTTNGSAYLAPTAGLSVSLYGGFIPKVGQSYVIFSNGGTNPSVVSGTFNGLAEGASYTSQGVTYAVSYKGGDGNDIVLTITAIDPSKLPKVPGTPNTGLALAAAHPLSTLGVTVVAAGSLYGLARRTKQPARR